MHKDIDPDLTLIYSMILIWGLGTGCQVSPKKSGRRHFSSNNYYLIYMHYISKQVQIASVWSNTRHQHPAPSQHNNKTFICLCVLWHIGGPRSYQTRRTLMTLTFYEIKLDFLLVLLSGPGGEGNFIHTSSGTLQHEWWWHKNKKNQKFPLKQT